MTAASPGEPESPPPASRARRILWACATLALGAAGGAVAVELNVPLPWMIGAMIATTVASLGGLPLFVHRRVRAPVVTILGVMLGSSFTPEIAAQMPQWWVTIAGLVVYVAAITAILTLYFLKLGGFDFTTAYFAGSPGGLNEMIIVGKEMGGDDRLIALVHAGRLLFVIIAVPLGFMLFEGYSQSARPPMGGALADWPLREVIILAACALAGGWLGWRIALPAGFILGPMMLSAAVHLAGWSESQPPAVLVGAAQVVIGCNIGARFANMPVRTVLRVMLLSLGSAAIMIAATLLLALAMRRYAPSSFQGLILAYAPGGLAEMSLVAFALAIDAAFVAAHHILRIVMIVIAAPLLFRLLARRKRTRPA